MPQSRQLAAIMFTDIVGYTALMGQDSKRAMELVRQAMTFQKSLVKKHHGIWIKEMGDGAMARFNTALDAVNCALDIQRASREDFQGVLRIGIHLGDINIENDDVFGDGVNVASRLQSIADPGGIYISESIEKAIRGQGATETVDLGEMELKNVNYGVRTYALKGNGLPAPTKKPRWEKLKKHRVWLIVAGVIWVFGWTLYPKFNSGTNADNGVPNNTTLESGTKSIAVLPFVNMSNDPEQEYFSDGISEEIINVLAQVTGLKVIGRTSSFAFKGKNLDLKLIGEQLKVSHILEGSVRRSGNKLRITAQLINVADGYHLYSETFDRELEDVFKIQDDISLAILSAIKIKLMGTEKDAVLKRYTENVAAYQLYLQGVFYYNKYTQDALMKAIEYFKAAIAIDSTYALAYSGMAYCYQTLFHWNWLPPEKSLQKALEAAHKSLALDSNIAESHLAVGRIKLHYEWKVVEAAVEFNKALAINPNSAECHVQLSMCAALLGNKKEAIEHSGMAISLDPFSPMNLWMATVATFYVGDVETTLENGKRIIDLDSTFFAGHMWVGIACMNLEKYQEGITALQLAAQLENGPFTLSALGTTYGLMGDKLKAREVITKLKSMEGIHLGGNGFIGDVYASIGELDSAFLYYDKSLEIHEGHNLWKKYFLLSIPELQKDPRTKKLLDRIGVPYE